VNGERTLCVWACVRADWGWAPVAFELLYFIVHAIPMWGLPTSAVRPMLELYCSVVRGTCGVGGLGARQAKARALQELTAFALAEEMLAVAVEWCVSFLADDSYDPRPYAEGQVCPRQVVRLKYRRRVSDGGTMYPVAAAQEGVSGVEVAAITAPRARWGFNSGYVRSITTALHSACQIDVILRLGTDLLFQPWGARDTELGKHFRSVCANVDGVAV
jgi:hypothetical protein